MRVAVDEIGVQAHDPEQLLDALSPLACGQDIVYIQRFPNDVAHRHARVQRGIGVLKDHLHTPPHPPQLLAFCIGQTLALEIDFACGRPVQLQDGPSGGRLATSTLSHQTKGLAAMDVESDSVHRLDVSDMLLENDSLRDRKIHL